MDETISKLINALVQIQNLKIAENEKATHLKFALGLTLQIIEEEAEDAKDNK